MNRKMAKGYNDPASYGAEALPAGFNEMSTAMRDHSLAAQGSALQQARAPLVGLIALAAHWMKKRAGRA